MVKAIFNFEGKETVIQCNFREYMKDICQKFINTIEKNNNQFIFIYGGDKINPKLTYENVDSKIDKERMIMNILVYEINKYEDKEKPKKIIQNEIGEEEINILKEKIHDILSKYLDDRKYMDNKTDYWRDAILKECEKLFLNYKEYKTFINIIINDISISEIEYHRYWKYYGVYYDFKSEFKTNKIKALIYVSIFKKKERKKKDLNKAFESIEKEFLNLAEGREYNIVIEKYDKMFKETIISEILKDLKNALYLFYEISNKYNKSSRGHIIVNKDVNDSFLSKFIQTDECSLYLLLGNAQ